MRVYAIIPLDSPTLGGSVEQIINRLIELMQQTAPQLWEIARQQVHTQVVLGWLWLGVGLVLLVGTIATDTLVFRAYRKHNVPRKALYSDGQEYLSEGHYWDENNKTPLLAFSAFITVIAVVMCFANINDIIARTLSPDYYAIQVLLNLIK
jgi:hypothetical protein